MADTAPRRRRLRSAERRETILDAAVAVFAEAGYERARVSDIAARVGVSEPVVFQNFGTKSALFEAALDLASARFAAHLREVAESAADVHAALDGIFSAGHLARLHQAGGVGVLFAEGVAGHGGAGAGRAPIARVARAIAGLLEKGQEQGTVRADVSAEAMAWWLLSLIHGRGFRRAMAGPAAARLERELHPLTLSLLRPGEISLK
jgi:AcrR family transcriptional regulator